MKRTSIVAAVVSAVGASACPAQESVDRSTAAAFGRMFGGPLSQKIYARIVRRYDASHLAQHPKQKVSAMKLLVTAEEAADNKTVNYSFRLAFKDRRRPGNFDSTGCCSQIVAESSVGEIRLGCGVDGEGRGIEVVMKNEKLAPIRRKRIRIWERNKADDDASNDLVAGADDGIFRVDRADLHECSELVTDRKELAALRRN